MGKRGSGGQEFGPASGLLDGDARIGITWDPGVVAAVRGGLAGGHFEGTGGPIVYDYDLRVPPEPTRAPGQVIRPDPSIWQNHGDGRSK